MLFRIRKPLNGFVLFEGIRFEVISRDVRYFRVEFKGPVPKIILPFGSDLLSLLDANREKILKKYHTFLELDKRSASIHCHNRNLRSLKEIVQRYVDLYSSELKVTVKEIRFRKMKRIWGNCRDNGVITLNSWLAELPERLISYIVYHEMLHLAVSGGHSPRFRKYMKKRFPDIKKIENSLRVYSIRLNGSGSAHWC